MSGVQGSVGFALTVAGQAMPVRRVDVTSGTYGSAGHLTAETSIKATGVVVAHSDGAITRHSNSSYESAASRQMRTSG